MSRQQVAANELSSAQVINTRALQTSIDSGAEHTRRQRWDRRWQRKHRGSLRTKRTRTKFPDRGHRTAQPGPGRALCPAPGTGHGALGSPASLGAAQPNAHSSPHLAPSRCPRESHGEKDKGKCGSCTSEPAELQPRTGCAGAADAATSPPVPARFSTFSLPFPAPAASSCSPSTWAGSPGASLLPQRASPAAAAAPLLAALSCTETSPAPVSRLGDSQGLTSAMGMGMEVPAALAASPMELRAGGAKAHPVLARCLSCSCSCSCPAAPRGSPGRDGVLALQPPPS